MYENIKVSVISHTNNIDKTIALAAKTCYSNNDTETIQGHLLDNPDKVYSIIKTCLLSGHHSVFEHGSITFSLEGVSRSLLAQLTRHRIASYSVRSQRYCDMGALTPEKLAKPASTDNDVLDNFLDAYFSALTDYNTLKNLGVPLEDARYVLPEGTPTTIIVTMNIRELRHFFGLRCCSRAQHEIRYVANKMLELAKPLAPCALKWAGPKCALRGVCTENESCGKYPSFYEVMKEYEATHPGTNLGYL